MSYRIHGTCGRCGGAVTTPLAWGGIFPPIPTCNSCGARVAQPHGQILPMEEPPKRFEDIDGKPTLIRDSSHNGPGA